MSYKYQYQEISHKGNVRENNEDSCENKETSNGHLFVLCDGMGGAVGGKKASGIAVKSIVEFFEREEYENIQIALNKSLEFANEQIYATAQTYPDFKGMGTTACVLLIKDDLIHYAHVGDSRIYLTTDEKLYQLTNDHSFVNQLIKQGTITAEEAKNHSQKNRILKAIGVHPQVEPSVSSQPTHLKKDDILLLCSDGLSDMVSDEMIHDTLSIKGALSLKTKSLLNQALDNGGVDNISIQTIEIEESPYKTTSFINKNFDAKTNNTISKKPIQNKRLISIISFIGLVFLLSSIYFTRNYLNSKVEKQVKQQDSIFVGKEKIVNPLVTQDTTHSLKKQASENKQNSSEYFIIGNTKDTINNIYKSLHQFKIMTENKITDEKFIEINDVQPTGLIKGQRYFTSQEAKDKFDKKTN